MHFNQVVLLVLFYFYEEKTFFFFKFQEKKWIKTKRKHTLTGFLLLDLEISNRSPRNFYSVLKVSCISWGRKFITSKIEIAWLFTLCFHHHPQNVTILFLHPSSLSNNDGFLKSFCSFSIISFCKFSNLFIYFF